MKLGYALPMCYEPGRPDPYRKTFELARIAEDAGFSFGSIPHHSFTPHAEDYAAPLLVMAAVAARTSQLRIASTIFILPLHQPAAIAEQLTQLDRISGGRLIFGVGAGYRDYEFAGHGIDLHSRGRRMNEMLEVIRGAFETGYLEFSGEFFQIPRTLLTPAPVQRPHPPIWVGGSSDAALRRAARLGDGWISENLAMLDGIAQQIGSYRRFAAEAGRQPGDVVVIRNAAIAETREEIERSWLPGMIAYHLFNRENYRKAGIEMPDPDGTYTRLEAGGSVDLAAFTNRRAIAGTPDDCLAQIELWQRETGCDHLHLVSTTRIATEAEFEAQKRFITLFGRHVIPAL